MVALPNTKIDSSMIEEFSSPIFEEQNHKKYMFVDEDGKVIYKDVTALIDDINEDGGILGTNNKVVIRDWEPNYEYKEKETITYNNAIWKCIVKKSKKEEFDFNDWKMLAGYSKSSEFFYDAENEITEIVLEEEVASKGSFLININNLLLQSNNYFLNSDNKTITFVNPVPKDTQIEVTVFGNMIIPTNVDNVVTKTFTTIADGETEFFVDEPMYKKGLVTVNIENKVLLQSEWELNEGTDGIILKNGVPSGTRVQIQYFNNLDLSIGATFTPHVSKSGRIVTISWTNDQDLPNPENVTIEDGITFTPMASKFGKKSTISWTNDGGKENPQTLNIFDGATFTPHVSKTDYTTTLSWTNDGDLPNPQNVQILDGVNFIPSSSRNNNYITISWSNDQGKHNPNDAILYDGTTFTPQVEKIGKTTTLSWTNDGGKENPDDVNIVDGTTFIPSSTKEGNQTIISWSNDGGLPNPQNVTLYDGTTFTPSWNKIGYTANISWTNDGGKENPPVMQLFDGVTFTPHTTRTGNRTTLSWTNNQGKQNPESTYIFDGAIFTPHIVDYEYNNKRLYWTNDRDLPKPSDSILIGGTTFTPVITTINDSTDRISWINDGGKENPQSIDISDGTTFTPIVTKNNYTATIAWSNDGGKINPSTVQITDGINWTPHVYKDSEAYKTTLSWTNDQGVSNPDPVDIYEGRIYDVLLNGTSIVNERVASFTLGTMSQEDKNDYVLLSAYNDKINELENADQTLQNNIDSEENRASNVEGNLSNLVTNDKTNLVSAINEVHNNTNDVSDDLSTHIADTNNPHQVTKVQVGLGNVDNTSDLDKPISTATQTALDGKVDKVTTPSRVYGTDASGNQTSYDYDSFGKVDDVKVGTTSVVSNKIATLGTMAGEATTSYYTKSELDGKLSGAMHFKGTKATFSDLPSSGQEVGDMYNVTETGANYAWDGSAWDKLSENIDLSGLQPNLTSANAGTGISIIGSGSNVIISNTQTSAEWGNITGTLSNQTDLQNVLNGKQETLVSGTNIKTINNTSLLESGNISITEPSIATTSTAGIVKPDGTSIVVADDGTISTELSVLSTKVVVDSYTATNNQTVFQLSKKCDNKDYLSVNVSNSELTSSSYELANDGMSVTLLNGVAEGALVDIRYFSNIYLGDEGATFTPSVSKTNYTTTLSWSNNRNLPNPSNVNIYDGVIWTPAVTATTGGYNLSWTNNQGKTNPSTVFINSIYAVGTWSSTISYNTGNLVTYEDSNYYYGYIAKQNIPAGTALTNNNYWTLAYTTAKQYIAATIVDWGE